MNKINWLGLYRDEVQIEIDNRNREIAKLSTEIGVYWKVKDELEKIIHKLKQYEDEQAKKPK